MRIYKLLYVLYKIKMLSPIAVFRLISAISKYGINLMTQLNFAARNYGEKVALSDEQDILTYSQLFAQSEQLSFFFSSEYQLVNGKKVGLICRNHASLVKAIYAVSLSGADLYLLNAEMSISQFNDIIERHDFQLLIFDEERSSLIEQSSYKKAKLLSYHHTSPAINNIPFVSNSKKKKTYRNSTSKLVLLTGGTTGKAKEAAHKSSLFNYLDPFFDFLNRLKILNYRTAYIATPIYHGYGIAVLLLFCALGKKVVIRCGFDAEKACQLIQEHQVEVVTVVPLMLHKMLHTNAAELKSLACIASGSAELNPKLVAETFEQLGEVLYNLYGTSETGLNIIATPQDLAYSPYTIGRRVNGIHLRIVNDQKKEAGIGSVGQLCMNNSWSMRNKVNSWIETGDLGFQDKNGYYFLCGRADSMIVSAGENVYPLEVEQLLITHPQIEDVAVIGISDEHFGQRLKAIVQLAPQTDTTEEELFEWLRPKLARFQMPKEIIFIDHLPYTALGKVDKKLLGG